MKESLNIFFIILILMISGCGNRINKEGKNSSLQLSDTGKAVLSFSEYEYDFGKVNEGEKVKHEFKFRNTGSGDLVIRSATASCGCTVPGFDAKPIPPGEYGTLDVVFNTKGRYGMQSKTITVKSNANKPVMLLNISAEVITK